MKIIVTNPFKKSAKKLRRSQISQVEDVIESLKKEPYLGELKKGDLAGIRVYKFYINNQLLLLAYQHLELENEITLLSLSTHENFYRDLKKRV